MCNFDVPQLLFYTHIPTLIIGLLLGFFIFMSDKKNPINRNLSIFIVFLCFWIISDLLPWLSFSVAVNLFFVRILPLVSLSLVFFLYFTYALLGEKISIKRKIIYVVPYIPFIMLLFSNYNAYVTNANTCDSGYGPLIWYVSLINLTYTFFAAFKIFKHYKKININNKEKNQSKIIIYSIAFIILWFLTITILANAYSNEEIYLLTPIGIVVFIGLLAYAITKYQFLNLKLIAAQVLTYSIWALISSQYFFADSLMVKLLITLTLLLSLIFGDMLIKSIKLEVQRKEELQGMSDKLSEANEQLRKLDNSKSEFISIASHQLRTPLTAIKGFVSLLLEGSYGQIVPKQQDILNKVYTANERLVMLVEDLLNISRMESGRMEFKFAPWDISNICQEVMDTFMPRAKEDNKYLEYKKPETPLPEIMIDGVKVREVLSNMVDNALKYTPKGGVTLKVEQADASRYILNSHGDVEDKPIVGPVIRVTVSDTGIGIPATELPYLFAKFSRGKDISRLNTGGTGLGLYVGRSMIENNGGKIWAESDGQGQGSRFIIEMPMRQSAELMERWG